MTPAREDYFLARISRSNPVTGTYWTARSSGSANRRSGDVCSSHCRSCIFDTQQLKREPSLLCGFGQAAGDYRVNAGGF